VVRRDEHDAAEIATRETRAVRLAAERERFNPVLTPREYGERVAVTAGPTCDGQVQGLRCAVPAAPGGISAKVRLYSNGFATANWQTVYVRIESCR
jgi:hypothetical protein